MNWMTSGRHRAMKTTLAKRKQKMRFPAQSQRNQPHRSVPVIPEPPPDRRRADSETPWYILPREMNEESHDIHVLEFGRDRGDKKSEDTPKKNAAVRSKPADTRKQDMSDVTQTAKERNKTEVKAPNDRRCVFTPVKAKKHVPPERRTQSAIQPRRNFHSESPSSVLMFNEGENLSQAQRQRVNEHPKKSSAHSNAQPSYNTKSFSPKSQSRLLSRDNSCGTTENKTRSHGFFMDDDDSSSENESLQAFIQADHTRLHGTREQLSTRPSALSMSSGEYNKFENEKRPTINLSSDPKARRPRIYEDEDDKELHICKLSATMTADREQLKFTLPRNGLSCDALGARTNASTVKFASVTSSAHNSRPIFRFPFSKGLAANLNKTRTMTEQVDSDSYSSQDSPVVQPPPFEWQKKAFQIRLQQEQHVQRVPYNLVHIPRFSPPSSPKEMMEKARKGIVSSPHLPKGLILPSPDTSGTPSSQSDLPAVNEIVTNNTIKSPFNFEVTSAKRNVLALPSNGMKRPVSEVAVLSAQEISPKRLKTQRSSKQWVMASRTKKIVEMMNTKSNDDKRDDPSVTSTKAHEVGEITSVAIYMCTLVECYKINEAYKRAHG